MRFEFSAGSIVLTIDRFAAGRLTVEEWSLFLEGPWMEPKFEAIRQQLLKIRRDFPPRQAGEWCSPEGIVALRVLADRLRKGPGRWILWLCLLNVVLAFQFATGGPSQLFQRWQLAVLVLLHGCFAAVLLIYYFRRLGETKRTNCVSAARQL